MKALNFEGQLLIDNSIIRGALNRICSVNCIQESVNAIKDRNIEIAKNNVCVAYEKIFDAKRSSFLVVRGLIPLVLNEQSDARNHNILTEISDLLYDIYSDFFRLDVENYQGENVISYRTFQLYRIIKRLAYVVNALICYERINSQI